MLSKAAIKCYYTINNDCLSQMKIDHPKGESMKVGFDGGIELEFHGAKVTSDDGLLAYRDLDDALGLFDSVSAVFNDKRTECNIQHCYTHFYANPSMAVLQDMKMSMTQSANQLILSCE